MKNKYFVLSGVIVCMLLMLSKTSAQNYNSYVYEGFFSPTEMIVVDMNEKRINVGDVGGSMSAVRKEMYIFVSKHASVICNPK